MLLYRLELGPPTSRVFYFHWTTEAIKYEGPCCPAIFWGKNVYRCDFLLISSYPSLLISSYSSFLIFESVCCITDIHSNFYEYLYLRSDVSSLGRYVFGSEISYNKAPPRLPGLGC
jgi:hypothetical protein